MLQNIVYVVNRSEKILEIYRISRHQYQPMDDETEIFALMLEAVRKLLYSVFGIKRKNAIYWVKND